MKKERFIELMEDFIKLYRKEEKIQNAVSDANFDFMEINLGYWHGLFIETLAEMFEDPIIAFDWIETWIWEYDFGTSDLADSVNRDGKQIPFRTISDLYDCINQ